MGTTSRSKKMSKKTTGGTKTKKTKKTTSTKKTKTSTSSARKYTFRSDVEKLTIIEEYNKAPFGEKTKVLEKYGIFQSHIWNWKQAASR